MTRLAVFLCAHLPASLGTFQSAYAGLDMPAAHRGLSPVESVISLADSLAAAGLHYDAVTEYKRALFVDPDHPERSEILSRIAFSSARLEDWNGARSAIDEALRSAGSDSSRECAEMDRAVIFIASGSPGDARNVLERIARGSPRADSRLRAGRILLAASVLSNDWSAGLSSYRSFVKGTDARSDSLEAALEAAASAPRLSPQTAAVLSILLPGSGQMYAGRWWNGIGALVVNGGFGYLTVKSIVDGSYAAGAVEFLFLFRRYYLGNLQNAADAAAAKNDAADALRRREILQTLSRLTSPSRLS